jgi:recombination protein RecA
MERRLSTLDALVAQLQQRYGSGAARRASTLPVSPIPRGIPTGIQALDDRLPHGGLPRDVLSELVGPRSAGATTLALSVVARAQAAGELVCMLDINNTFAPTAAAGAGVDLETLAVARPADGAEAALVVATLLARRAVGVLVIDSLPAWLALPGGPAALATLRSRLPRLLRDSGCAVIILHPLPTGLLPDPADVGHGALAPTTALRLRLAHRGWLRHGPAIVGSRTQITLLLPPFTEPFASLEVELRFARGEDQA